MDLKSCMIFVIVHSQLKTIALTGVAAVRCVRIDKLSFAQGKKTVKQVGQSRFLGSAIFHAHQIAKAQKAV